MLMNIPLEALVAIVAGIVILVVPRVLPYTVAVYLLVVGVLGLAHAVGGRAVRAEPLIALVAGVLILVKPAILSYVVGGYLIVVGLLGMGILRL